MAIEIFCPACHKNFRVKPELAGKRVRCECGSPIAVPEFSENLPAVGENLASPENSPSTPNPTPLPRSPKSNFASKKSAGSEKSKGSFRNVDVIFIVVGALVALSGLRAVFGFLNGVTSLSSFSTDYPHLELLPDHFRARMFISAFGGILVSLTRIALGICGVGIAYYVYEKRNNGKSTFGWAFLAGAIAGVVSILVSIAFRIAMLVMFQPSENLAMSGISAVASLSGLALSGLLPIAMIVVYAERKKLKYRELL